MFNQLNEPSVKLVAQSQERILLIIKLNIDIESDGMELSTGGSGSTREKLFMSFQTSPSVRNFRFLT